VSLQLEHGHANVEGKGVPHDALDHDGLGRFADAVKEEKYGSGGGLLASGVLFKDFHVEKAAVRCFENVARSGFYQSVVIIIRRRGRRECERLFLKRSGDGISAKVHF
jgi:hypothetical protein